MDLLSDHEEHARTMIRSVHAGDSEPRSVVPADEQRHGCQGSVRRVSPFPARFIRAALYIELLAASIVHPQVALAEIHSGTIVVIAASKNKVVVAADSRALLEGGPDDMQCKVCTPKGEFIFFGSGIQGYGPIGRRPDWTSSNDVTEIAKEEPRGVEPIASRWRIQMENRLRSIPPRELVAVSESEQLGTAGFCGIGSQGQLVLIRTAFAYVKRGGEVQISSSIQPLALGDQIAWYRVGRTEIVDEFLFGSGKRAAEEREDWVLRKRSPEWKAIRLVQLTAAVHPRRNTVGGPVDAVEISETGRIRWIQRKANCPEN